VSIVARAPPDRLSLRESKLRDLHVTGPDPHVVVRFGSKGKLPKNGKVRRVPLFGLGLAAARGWLDVLPTYAPKNPDRLVFPGPTGARRRIGAPYQSKKETTLVDGVKTVKVPKVELFHTWLEAAGIKRHLRWHDMRHTCGSSLVAGWWGRHWTLEEVKEMLGHSDISVTQKCAHLVASALQQAARESGSNLVPGRGFGGSGIAAITNDFEIVGRTGLEPVTYGLKVRSSTN